MVRPASRGHFGRPRRDWSCLSVAELLSSIYQAQAEQSRSIVWKSRAKNTTSQATNGANMSYPFLISKYAPRSLL